jgi:LysM repeat protein
MQWKDSEDTIDAEQEEAEAYYEEEYSPLGGKGRGATSQITRKTAWPIIVGVPLVLIVLVLIYALIPGRSRSANREQLQALEKRIEMLEKRMLKIEGLSERVAILEKSAKDAAGLSKRFDRLESAMGKRMDQVDKELIDIGKAFKRQRANTAAAATAKQTKTTDTQTQYHIVKKGDTLYSISRRHGLSVERLRSINKLGQKTDIFIGQKLKLK